MTLDPLTAAQANTDARSALGIRPGARPIPRVVIDDIYEDIAVPPSPRQHNESNSPNARHISIAIPRHSPISPVSLAVISPEPSRRFRRPTLSRKLQPSSLTANRGLYETQKLLGHLLDRLEAREPAPDVLDRAAIAAREASGRPKGKANSRVRRLGQAVAARAGLANALLTPPSTAGISSEDAEDKVVLDEGEWDTDEAADLVEQMRGLLVLAEKQGLDLFGTVISPNTELAPSPTRARRKTGRFSSVTSPMAAREGHAPSFSVSGADLLHRLTAVLQSLISVDCIHRAHLFRPLRPPNALQAACLDVAAYLYHKCELDTKLDMLETVTDGMYGMGEGMAERICEWLEGRLGELLGRLARERSGLRDKVDLEFHDPFAGPPKGNVPTFAFSSEPPEAPRAPPSSGWMRYSPTTSQSAAFPFPAVDASGVLSTHAADHFSASILRIAALVPRILVAITTNIDVTASKLTTIYRVHRLLSLILTAKADAPLDLLEIVAQASPLVRRRSLDILATFYPEATGHNTVARRPALATYAALRARWESGQERVLAEDNVEGHHYIPWRASLTDETRCTACQTVLQGFCVRCTMCNDHRHLHCHQPPSDQVFVYDVIILSATDSTPHTVYVKFSKCLPRIDERVVHGASPREQATMRRVGHHELHLVHVFNLTLCEACHEPVWGMVAQAYACIAGCQRFFHPACLDGLSVPCRYGREVVVDELSDARPTNPFTIGAAALRTSFEASGLLHDIDKLSYDEAAVHYAALWVQHQLVKNGIASGSLRTISESRRSESDILGLRKTLKRVEAHLAATAQHASTATLDFVHVTSSPMLADHDLFWSPRYLAYCTALLRAPSGQQAPSSPGLSVSNAGGVLTAGGTGTDPMDDAPHAAFETVPMLLIKRSLGLDVNLQDERVAALFLQHLCMLGLCAVPRRSVDSDALRADVDASFTLPLLMDSSPTVELLILAIEALLDDLDLTSNEHAFRLLATRAWPSLLCSPYALERLGGAVIGWIMTEDDVIHRIVKDYASKRKRLPGVRATAGPGGAKSAATVGMYKNDRRRLLDRHAVPWLAALHAQDAALYAHVAYEQCKAPAGWAAERPDDAGSQVATLALERLAALAEAGAIFSVLLDLLTAWLEDLGGLAEKDAVYKSLPRLLVRPEAVLATADGEQDLWGLAAETSRSGPDGLDRVCRWTRVLAFSGAEVPWPTLTSLLDLQTSTRSSMDARLDLAIAIASNGAAIDGTRFAQIASHALATLTLALEQRSTAAAPTPLELDVLRQSLALVLRAYGVPPEELAGSLLANERAAPGTLRRQRAVVGRQQPVPLDPEMVMSAANVLRLPHFPAEIMLDFFWLLFTRAHAVDNVGGFLHHMCGPMYEVIWPLFDRPVDRHRRARLFLKLLTINPAPIEQLVHQQLEILDRSTIRERLLTFGLELADVSATFEVHGYRAPAVGLLLLLFESLLDTSHAADMTPDSLVVLHALRPTQLAAIARCFEEQLARASDERRLDLLARLGRLRAVLPRWPILSWECIEELLVEAVSNINHLRNAESHAARDALHDAEAVRANGLALGLEMLAAGIEIQWSILHQFQQHVASACATPWPRGPAHAPSNRPASFAAGTASLGPLTVILPALRQVLDSPTRVAVGITGNAIGDISGGKSKKTALVGSLFVPVVVDFAAELPGRDYVTQRTILDVMLVLFFKQNVQPVELSALSTLQLLAAHATDDACGENRLLAIHVLSTALRRMPRDSAVRALPTLFCAVARVLDKENANGGDSAVAEQARALLQYAITTFRRPGMYLQLFRADNTSKPGEAKARPVGPSALGKALKALVTDDAYPKITDAVLADLSDVFKRGKQTINEVLHALEGFFTALDEEMSEDAVHNFGAFITRLGKHIGEYSGDEFDANPILRCCRHVLPLAPSMASTALLHQTSTLLHLALARFAVLPATIGALLAVSGAIAGRQQTEDTVKTVLFEQAGSAVNGLHVTPVTLQALLEFLVEQAETGKRNPQLIGLSPGCVNILLRSHPAMVSRADAELTIETLVAAANVILWAELGALGNLSRVLSPLPTEAAAVQLGVYVPLLFASLSWPLGSARHSLTTLYPLVGRAAAQALRAASDLLAIRDASSDGAELLNASFVATRLALLAAREPEVAAAAGRLAEAARRVEGEYDDRIGRAAVDTFWARVWPEWNRLLVLSLDATCVNGPLRAVTHSIVLDLIIFLAPRPRARKQQAPLSAVLGALAAWSEAQGAAPGAKWARAAAALARADDAAGAGAVANGVKVHGRAGHAARVGSAGSLGALGGGAQPKTGRQSADADEADAVRSVRGDMVATERLRVLRAAL
ncbi:hypothetical protein Q5752_004458 [Cryptotrichosporon argae]